MAICSVCGDVLTPGATVCALCGTSLHAAGPAVPPWKDEALPWNALDEPPPAPARVVVPVAPAAGTRCLVLYGADKKPLHYFPLRHDVTLIGRLDALQGSFPGIDLGEWLDGATARKVSRKHALVLYARTDDRFSLRPLAGNTGTQIDADMVPPLKDYPLRPGTRLVLGGAVRLKFEVIS
jgi:hypothetical protein